MHTLIEFIHSLFHGLFHNCSNSYNSSPNISPVVGYSRRNGYAMKNYSVKYSPKYWRHLGRQLCSCILIQERSGLLLNNSKLSKSNPNIVIFRTIYHRWRFHSINKHHVFSSIIVYSRLFHTRYREDSILYASMDTVYVKSIIVFQTNCCENTTHKNSQRNVFMLFVGAEKSMTSLASEKYFSKGCARKHSSMLIAWRRVVGVDSRYYMYIYGCATSATAIAKMVP